MFYTCTSICKVMTYLYSKDHRCQVIGMIKEFCCLRTQHFLQRRTLLVPYSGRPSFAQQNRCWLAGQSVICCSHSITVYSFKPRCISNQLFIVLFICHVFLPSVEFWTSATYTTIFRTFTKQKTRKHCMPNYFLVHNYNNCDNNSLQYTFF